MHKDSRGYWYRSKRNGSRVTREYIGRGELAALLAQMDANDRRDAEIEREQREAAQARHAAIDGQIEALCADTDRMVREVLEAAGYHQHDRGQWRKRRGKQSD